ncbi:hypothetical protein ABZU86_31440 [Streptomyces sp. NPDC005271]|uniref:hypothetical protein n=1 Tax=unclassified Streptomyces TaxID=2593676 RepID=UPI0033AB0A0C
MASVVGEGVDVDVGSGESVDGPFVEGLGLSGERRAAEDGEATRHEARAENQDAFFTQGRRRAPSSSRALGARLGIESCTKEDVEKLVIDFLRHLDGGGRTRTSQGS